jgi:hypothetical protein
MKDYGVKWQLLHGIMHDSSNDKTNKQIIRRDSDGFGTDRTIYMHERQISFLMISHPKQHGRQGPFLMLATYEQCTSAHALRICSPRYRQGTNITADTAKNKLPDFTSLEAAGNFHRKYLLINYSAVYSRQWHMLLLLGQ